jgi:hypothetical protein
LLKGNIEARGTQQGKDKRKTKKLSPDSSVKAEAQELQRPIETTGKASGQVEGHLRAPVQQAIALRWNPAQIAPIWRADLRWQTITSDV